MDLRALPKDKKDILERFIVGCWSVPIDDLMDIANARNGDDAVGFSRTDVNFVLGVLEDLRQEMKD